MCTCTAEVSGKASDEFGEHFAEPSEVTSAKHRQSIGEASELNSAKLVSEFDQASELTSARHRSKLKDEVGIAGSKSTQTRFVRIIISIKHPYACFLSMGCKSNVTESKLTILSHRGYFLLHASQEHSLKDSTNKSTSISA